MKKVIIIVNLVMAFGIASVFGLSKLGAFGNTDERNVSSAKTVRSSSAGSLKNNAEGTTAKKTQKKAKDKSKNNTENNFQNSDNENNADTTKVVTAPVINENNNAQKARYNVNGVNSGNSSISSGTKAESNSKQTKSFQPRVKVNENTKSRSVNNSNAGIKKQNDASVSAQSKGSSVTLNNSVSKGTSLNNGSSGQSVINNSVNKYDASEFQKYVYNQDGETCFKYTGTDHSTIVIPEGVTRIDGFTEDQHSFNKEITTVVIPSTVEAIMCSNMYYDGNFYSVLYQCVNLKNVTGGNVSYQCYGNYVMRPGEIYIWSPSVKYKHDINNYINVDSSKVASDISAWTRLHK